YDASNGKILSRGYTPILTNLLSNLLTPPIPVCVVNEGLGGTTSIDGRNRLTETLDRYPASQIWLILFGTNDSSGAFPILSGVGCQEPQNFDPDDPEFDPDSLGTFKDSMRTIILELKTQNKVSVLGYVPYIQNMPQFRDDLINQYNQVIYDLWQFHNLPVAPPDFYQHFSDPANQDKFYDSTHPNGAGYIDIANMWYVELVNSGILN
ncbi:SGNH/GDSL hydrolase family protein, partial [bacterium]|nr:SGNH/GDSL hydrolase family protein [bacterium]